MLHTCMLRQDADAVAGTPAEASRPTKATLLEVGNPHPLAVRRPGRGKGLPEMSDTEKASRRRKQATERQRRKRARDAAGRARKAHAEVWAAQQGDGTSSRGTMLAGAAVCNPCAPTSPTHGGAPYGSPPPPPQMHPPSNAKRANTDEEEPNLSALDILYFAAASVDHKSEVVTPESSNAKKSGCLAGPRAHVAGPSKGKTLQPAARSPPPSPSLPPQVLQRPSSSLEPRALRETFNGTDAVVGTASQQTLSTATAATAAVIGMALATQLRQHQQRGIAAPTTKVCEADTPKDFAMVPQLPLDANVTSGPVLQPQQLAHQNVLKVQLAIPKPPPPRKGATGAVDTKPTRSGRSVRKPARFTDEEEADAVAVVAVGAVQNDRMIAVDHAAPAERTKMESFGTVVATSATAPPACCTLAGAVDSAP
jgi:hypothetical protein